MIAHRSPRASRRPWVWWLLGCGLGFVIVVVGLVVFAVLRARTDQHLSLPPPGQTLETTPPTIPKGAMSRFSQTAITQGNVSRPIWIITPPDSQPTDRLPVVIVLHGRAGTPATEFDGGEWDAAVAAHHFIAVFPTGVFGSWDAGKCCRLAMTLGVRDVDFLDAIVHDMKLRPEVDPTRIFMAGDSNGGMMTYAYLCYHSDQLAGAASVTGTNDSGCTPRTPIPVLHVAGTDDDLVPYEGGSTAASIAFASGSFPPVRDSVAEVAMSEGCSSKSVETREGLVRTEVWPNCRAGSRVQLVTIDGATHKWPVGEPYDATEQVLRFFGIAR